MSEPSARDLWLRRIGLLTDPFLAPVAEQEADMREYKQQDEISDENAQLQKDIPLFYRYFSPPVLVSTEGPVSMAQLRQPRHALIFGEPGVGKTTLKLNLDANIRIRLDQTLVVNYEIGEDDEDTPEVEEHSRRLARALAVDLVIQILEQLPANTSEFSDNQLILLRQQIGLAGHLLQRVLRAIQSSNTENQALEMRAGIGAYWRRINRYAVRYVAPSPAILFLIERLLDRPISEPDLDNPNIFWDGVQTAKAWGYKNILILVDGADARTRDPQTMLKLISPVIGLFQVSSREDVYFKLFLPLELQSDITSYMKHKLPDLHSHVLNATIIWNEDALQQLLAQRFRAAGSPTIQNLDVLAGADLVRGLDRPARELAGGSPRKLLRIVDKLIEIHVSQSPNKTPFDLTDWEMTIQSIQEDSQVHQRTSA